MAHYVSIKNITMEVYCTYHNKWGHCTEEDYNDAKEGRSPSKMVRVEFDGFGQAVPFHTLVLPEDMPKNPVNNLGLRYVSPEVGEVDEDEEYY